MESGLKSLSKLFSERIFRIPDYQRGYSWTRKQLQEFWGDIELLQDGHHHYIGVLTLELTPDDKHQHWDEDQWLIKSKSYKPYFVVDGQQRLTTITILIQCILEAMKADSKLNFSSKDEIQSKYIYIPKDSASGSFIFGYEKDNPSYHCLKTKILHKNSNKYSAGESTIYTKNLLNAKEFLSAKVKSLRPEHLERLFFKVSQGLLFNVFHIEKEVDVHVAFETMNNRGIQLSNLELLKNRLIYLTTQLAESPSNKNDLRRAINTSWRTVYYYLGKNSKESLSDDFFLLVHFVLYFGKKLIAANEKIFDNGFTMVDSRNYYKQYLLDTEFTVKRVVSHKVEDRLTSTDIYNYAIDLKRLVEFHYQIAFPEESGLGQEEKKWLSRLRRLIETTHSREISALLLLVFSKTGSTAIRADFLSLVERYFFLASLLPYRFRQKNGNMKVTSDVVAAIHTKNPVAHLETRLKETTDSLMCQPGFAEALMEGMAESGYYGWPQLKYFLFEYECHLKEKSRRKSDKIDWKSLIEDDYEEDHSSIEHILPQTATDKYWKAQLAGLSASKVKKLTNSLGNLVALSSPRNSSLRNRPFPEKVGSPDKRTGYKFGSYSENEVALNVNWGPHEILKRGLELLGFMEERWKLNLGDAQAKKKQLGLEFL